MPNTGNLYLAIYNTLQLAGWSLALWKTIHASLLKDKGEVYTEASPVIREQPSSFQAYFIVACQIIFCTPHCQGDYASGILSQDCVKEQHSWRLFMPFLVSPSTCFAARCIFAKRQSTTCFPTFAGVVRASWVTAFLQWFGQSNVLFAILSCVSKVRFTQTSLLRELCIL